VSAELDLWLVRHGATEWSQAGRINGWTDVPLSESGRAQARTLAAGLDASRFQGIWSSDLQRAVETARLAVGTACQDPRLRELDFGQLEGRTWDECSPRVQRSLLDFDRFAAPGGESVNQLRSRVLAFIDSLPHGAHLVFTHGGVIRVLRQSPGRVRDATDKPSRTHVAPGEIVRVS